MDDIPRCYKITCENKLTEIMSLTNLNFCFNKFSNLSKYILLGWQSYGYDEIREDWTLMKFAKEFNYEICTCILRRGDGLMVHHGTIPIMVLLRPGATMTALLWFLQVNGMVSLVATDTSLSARFRSTYNYWHTHGMCVCKWNCSILWEMIWICIYIIEKLNKNRHSLVYFNNVNTQQTLNITRA